MVCIYVVNWIKLHQSLQLRHSKIKNGLHTHSEIRSEKKLTQSKIDLSPISSCITKLKPSGKIIFLTKMMHFIEKVSSSNKNYRYIMYFSCFFWFSSRFVFDLPFGYGSLFGYASENNSASKLYIEYKDCMGSMSII